MDPTLAAHYIAKSEKIEDAANQGEEEAEAAGAGTSNIDETRDAVAVISSDGVITFTNGNLCTMFGYTRSEIVGRNVALLMPQPYAQSHDRYVRAHLTSGQGRILNQVR